MKMLINSVNGIKERFSPKCQNNNLTNLTQRGTRGLGVLGNGDNKSDSCADIIEITFIEPQQLFSLEVRSLFNETIFKPGGIEEGDIDIFLGDELLNQYHVIGKDKVGTSNGSVALTGMDDTFDKIVFSV
jgi:hypothetical protein